MKKIFTSTLLILLFFPFSGNSQETPNSEDLQLKNGAREIMLAAGTCSLITLDENGEAKARAMDPFEPEEDFTIWFGTNSKSRKVNQIKNDPRVTLYYLDKDASGYVVIYGKAELINNPEAKKKWWKNAWEDFYQNKENDYLLIKVTPQSLEILSPPREINNDPCTWRPPILIFKTK